MYWDALQLFGSFHYVDVMHFIIFNSRNEYVVCENRGGYSYNI